MADRYLNYKEARDYLADHGVNVTVNTLRSWQYQRRGPSISVVGARSDGTGGLRLFRKSSLDAWLGLKDAAGSSAGGDGREATVPE